MPTSIYTSGPAAVMVGRSGYTGGRWVIGPQFLLGWCERSPVISMSSSSTPLFNTLGGAELPYEYIFQGSEYEVACVFTRWNEPILIQMRNTFANNVVFGYSATHSGSMGMSLVIYYPLIAALGIQADKGHRWLDIFPLVRVVRVTPHDMGNIGEKVEVVFHAIRTHVAASTELGPFAILGGMSSGYAFHPADDNSPTKVLAISGPISMEPLAYPLI